MRVRQAFAYFLFFALCVSMALAAEVAGKWTATINTQLGAMDYVYEFKVDGDNLTGKAISQFGTAEILEGKISDNEITFVEMMDNSIRVEYKGKISGNEIHFVRKVGELATENFIASRAK